MLKLNKEYYSLVWTVPNNMAQNILNLKDEIFVKLINAIMQNELYHNCEFLMNQVLNNDLLDIDFELLNS